MCGITGIYSFKSRNGIDQSLLKKMTEVLSYRGPDSEGYYTDSNVGLGHRRLSIIDLSEKGKQPMSNENDDVWIVFNGEIYNFMDLREDLEKKGHKFRSNTDTEVMIHAYEEYGEKCLNKFNGMFAFAIYDAREVNGKKQQKLFLARDRVGKKPLFYYRDEEKFVFASELKSIIEDKGIKREIDLEALSLYLSYGYIPAPKSIFKNIQKLLPAHYLVFENGKIKIKKYWDLAYRETGHPEEYYIKEFLKIFSESVKRRLISDVPLGAFLSGGIDSSAVVAFMSKLGHEPLNTFTIGFEEKGYDERDYARIVADKFNTNHREMIVKPYNLNILPKLVWYYNEPYSDSSALPSYFVANMTRKYVTVALNGDGGDESFAGYPKYALDNLFSYYAHLPSFMRKTLNRSIGLLPEQKTYSGFYHKIKKFNELSKMSREKRFAMYTLVNDEETKSSMISEKIKGLNINAEKDLINKVRSSPPKNFLNKMLYTDIKTYLPYDLLVKMDIATMANSLEARSPFLDYNLMEFAASMPPNLKLRGLAKKYLLKKALKNVLPRGILHRRKMGFAVPLDAWFRDDLEGFAYNTLIEGKTFSSEYIRKDKVKRIIEIHKSKTKDYKPVIWNLLWLEMWGRMYIRGEKLKNV